MPIMRVEITDVLLRTLRPPEKDRLEVWDTIVRELSIRLAPTGKYDEWAVRARQPKGKRIRTTLGGCWPRMSIKQARAQGRIKVGQIAGGRDPVAERRQAREAEAAKASMPTVKTRLGEWLDAHPEWSESYRRETERLCTKVIEPKLGDRPLRDTTREDWVALPSVLRKRTPGTATWLYSIISSFGNHAEAAGWIDRPLLPRKGLGVIAPRRAARERSLTDAELIAVWQASETLSPKTRAFIRLLMMTALRQAEAANLAVGEVDLMAARINLPASRTKSRRAHGVPLHPLLITELQAIWPDRRAGENYRLLGAVKGSGFSGFSKLKRMLDERLPREMQPWCWHDLRRTARTGMGRLGVSPLHGEVALNHVVGSALQRTYDRYDYTAEAVAALTVWQNHVAGLIAEAEAKQQQQLGLHAA